MYVSGVRACGCVDGWMDGNMFVLIRSTSRRLVSVRFVRLLIASLVSTSNDFGVGTDRHVHESVCVCLEQATAAAMFAERIVAGVRTCTHALLLPDSCVRLVHPSFYRSVVYIRNRGGDDSSCVAYDGWIDR
jgi:hypothetical protein